MTSSFKASYIFITCLNNIEKCTFECYAGLCCYALPMAVFSIFEAVATAMQQASLRLRVGGGSHGIPGLGETSSETRSYTYIQWLMNQTHIKAYCYDSGAETSISQDNQVSAHVMFLCYAHIPGFSHVCPCFFPMCRRPCAWKNALRWCGASNWVTWRRCWRRWRKWMSRWPP